MTIYGDSYRNPPNRGSPKAPAPLHARGNLTFDPTTGRSYGYWSEGEMVAASGGYGFGHDTFGRIINTLTNSVVVSYFVHDGNEMITAFDATGLAGRYVRGDGADELIAWYDGAGTASRRWAHADERGSIVAVSDSAGAAIAINRYDEYGKPAATNVGRFQYTGQMWLPEVGLYHYKNRVYAPHLGRFPQTDPIGYEGGMNRYAYVGNDPVNFVDPLGLEEGPNPHVKPIEPWVHPPMDVFGTRPGRCEACNTPGLDSMFQQNFADSLNSGSWGGGEGTVSCNELGCVFTPDVIVSGTKPVIKAQVIGPRIGPPPVLFVRPPWYLMRPPGWSNRWTWQRSPHRPGDLEPRWIDPRGGEWRWHGIDKYHDRPHWDYNPRNPVSSRWQHIYEVI